MAAKNENKLNLVNISKRLKSLPLLPSVICELMQLRPDSDDFFEKLAELSQYEPSLTARVLKVVNSIEASPVNPITDINQALIRAGSTEILSFITMLSVAQVFTPANNEQKKLWQHSVEVALFSEYLAKNSQSLSIDPSLAYTCGLLHDIGRFVLFNLSSNAVDFIAAKDWTTPEELPEVESKFLGFTHAQVGYLAARRWRLPKVIAKIIKHHHDYFDSELKDFPESFKQLNYIIQLSDHLSMYLMVDDGWKEFSHEKLTEEIENNCIYKTNKKLKINSDDLINQIPVIVDKGIAVMHKLKIS